MPKLPAEIWAAIIGASAVVVSALIGLIASLSGPQIAINIRGKRVSIRKADIKRSGIHQGSITRSVMNRCQHVSGDPLSQSGPLVTTRSQIKEMARVSGLLAPTRTNPHLRFLDGDITYWHEQGLTLPELRMQFNARRLVLEAADRDKVVIEDQGELSAAAGKFMAEMVR